MSQLPIYPVFYLLFQFLIDILEMFLYICKKFIFMKKIWNMKFKEPNMNFLKKTILPILLATIWISVSEFLRNELLFKSYWIEHYKNLGLVFHQIRSMVRCGDFGHCYLLSQSSSFLKNFPWCKPLCCPGLLDLYWCGLSSEIWACYQADCCLSLSHWVWLRHLWLLLLLWKCKGDSHLLY